MKILIDNEFTGGYHGKFEKTYSKETHDPAEFCLMFEYLQSYKVLLSQMINDNSVLDIVKPILKVKKEEIEKFFKKYDDLIEFTFNESMNRL
jgi:hypothetical protein